MRNRIRGLNFRKLLQFLNKTKSLCFKSLYLPQLNFLTCLEMAILVLNLSVWENDEATVNRQEKDYSSPFTDRFCFSFESQSFVLI